VWLIFSREQVVTISTKKGAFEEWWFSHPFITRWWFVACACLSSHASCCVKCVVRAVLCCQWEDALFSRISAATMQCIPLFLPCMTPVPSTHVSGIATTLISWERLPVNLPATMLLLYEPCPAPIRVPSPMFCTLRCTCLWVVAWRGARPSGTARDAERTPAAGTGRRFCASSSGACSRPSRTLAPSGTTC
jgi:hypothetical protein